MVWLIKQRSINWFQWYKMRGSRFKPTEEERKQVESMAGFGVPLDQISAIIRDGIDANTLSKHFKKEIIQGKARANSQVAETLFQKAIRGDTASCIFWAKTQMRWKEVIHTENKNENTSPDNSAAPIVNVNIDAALLKEIMQELDDKC
jgi:hypothetical protein